MRSDYPRPLMESFQHPPGSYQHHPYGAFQQHSPDPYQQHVPPAGYPQHPTNAYNNQYDARQTGGTYRNPRDNSKFFLIQ